MINKVFSQILIGLLAVSFLSMAGCSRSTGKISLADGAAKYPTPQAAADALNTAVQSGSKAAVEKIFGPDGMKVFNSGDSTADQNALTAFAERMKEKFAVAPSEEAKGQYELLVGDKEWPFPLPIVEGKGGWYYDVAAGAEEILNRRIGENELRTIRTMRTFVEAEKEYRRRDPDGDKVREYAQKIASSEGKKDGLYWKSVDGKNDSPFGPAVAEAVAEGYRKKENEPTPFHGYLFKMLYKDGPDASGGSKDFVDAHGNMTRGFALYAYPIRWGASGIMSFMVGTDGVVYQRDLGIETLAEANRVDAFNPDKTWEPVRDAGEQFVEDD